MGSFLLRKLEKWNLFSKNFNPGSKFVCFMASCGKPTDFLKIFLTKRVRGRIGIQMKKLKTKMRKITIEEKIHKWRKEKSKNKNLRFLRMKNQHDWKVWRAKAEACTCCVLLVLKDLQSLPGSDYCKSYYQDKIW